MRVRSEWLVALCFNLDVSCNHSNYVSSSNLAALSGFSIVLRPYQALHRKLLNAIFSPFSRCSRKHHADTPQSRLRRGAEAQKNWKDRLAREAKVVRTMHKFCQLNFFSVLLLLLF